MHLHELIFVISLTMCSKSLKYDLVIPLQDEKLHIVLYSS